MESQCRGSLGGVHVKVDGVDDLLQHSGDDARAARAAGNEPGVVGGDCARKIIYVQHSRDVLLQRLGHSADSVIATEEEKLYHRGIRKPEVSFFG